ncbi:MAG: DUF4162 domain-containing protein, partial [Actinomycetia bacterium]|nr:DUF4162 domain-containing protein [Actinomycetes bacterium]
HGTADELKTMIGGERIAISLQADDRLEDAHRVLIEYSVGDVHIEGRSLTAPVSGGAQTLTEVLRRLDTEGIALRDVGLRRPTLDDVFLSLTGHAPATEDDEVAEDDREATVEVS